MAWTHLSSSEEASDEKDEERTRSRSPRRPLDVDLKCEESSRDDSHSCPGVDCDVEDEPLELSGAQPRILPGCRWWQQAVWNALMQSKASRISSDVTCRPMRQVSLCAGTLMEAVCKKAPLQAWECILYVLVQCFKSSCRSDGVSLIPCLQRFDA
jgi:hypothetical protein